LNDIIFPFDRPLTVLFLNIVYFTLKYIIGQALELCVDFLLSSTPNELELSQDQPKIIFANPDFLWKAEFSRPRLGLGAFKTSLIAVYKERLRGLGKTEREIEERFRNKWLQLGKPMPSQYHFAERKMDLLLEDESSSSGGGGGGGKNNDRCIGSFYMIGDNQNTDIKGESFFISFKIHNILYYSSI
jgi:hypothetical protein